MMSDNMERHIHCSACGGVMVEPLDGNQYIWDAIYNGTVLDSENEYVKCPWCGEMWCWAGRRWLEVGDKVVESPPSKPPGKIVRCESPSEFERWLRSICPEKDPTIVRG